MDRLFVPIGHFPCGKFQRESQWFGSLQRPSQANCYGPAPAQRIEADTTPPFRTSASHGELPLQVGDIQVMSAMTEGKGINASHPEENH